MMPFWSPCKGKNRIREDDLEKGQIHGYDLQFVLVPSTQRIDQIKDIKSAKLKNYRYNKISFLKYYSARMISHYTQR